MPGFVEKYTIKQTKYGSVAFYNRKEKGSVETVHLCLAAIVEQQLNKFCNFGRSMGVKE